MGTRLSHLNIEERNRVNKLLEELHSGNPDNSILAEFGKLLSKADGYDPLKEADATIEAQSDIYESVWKEAEEIRKNGELLEYGKQITCPILVIHADYDPHPFIGVKEPLSKVIKDIRFVLLENCGHHPWLEKRAKEKFYNLLIKEL